MELRVTQYGEPILREKGKLIEAFDANLEQFAKDLLETMYLEEGIGLAAQQVNEALQMCVVDVREAYDCLPEEKVLYDNKQIPLELIMPLVVINPSVTTSEDCEYTVRNEGCLSFPGVVFPSIERPDKIIVSFQDLQGQSHILQCSGILSRCLQHEIDHLNGVLPVDHIDVRDLNSIKTKLKKLKRESLKFLKQSGKQ